MLLHRLCKFPSSDGIGCLRLVFRILQLYLPICVVFRGNCISAMNLAANGIIGADVKHMEGLLPKNYGPDVVEIPGARDLLDSVVRADVPWAIVTSGTTPLVTGWLEVLRFPVPEHLVVAEDVENGKPDPQCYLMGKEKLALADGEGEVLVLEDSPAGIAAGKAAGCKVLAVVTSHTVEQVLAAKPDWVVKDLKSVKVLRHSEAGVELEILDASRSE